MVDACIRWILQILREALPHTCETSKQPPAFGKKMKKESGKPTGRTCVCSDWVHSLDNLFARLHGQLLPRKAFAIYYNCNQYRHNSGRGSCPGYFGNRLGHESKHNTTRLQNCCPPCPSIGEGWCACQDLRCPPSSHGWLQLERSLWLHHLRRHVLCIKL